MLPPRAAWLARAGAALLLLITGAGLSPSTPAGAAGVSVIITDQGYVPASLTVPPGTTVTWVNQGQKVHTATSDTQLFDSGGLSTSASFSYLFNDPGNYSYHSETDISYQTTNTNTVTRTVPLSGVIVVVPGAPLPLGATTVPTALPPPPQPTPVSSAVSITDTAFNPPQVTVSVGGQVTFTNVGKRVHTATDDNGGWDTGGLGPGQLRAIAFTTPGTFPFHSETDSSPPGSKSYLMQGQVIVLAGPVPSPTVAASVPTATTAPVFTSLPSPALPQPNAYVRVVDNHFIPEVVTVYAGGSVTWYNDGGNVHTVTQDQFQFDSGGLPRGATYSQRFTTPGFYAYHSEPESMPPGSTNYTMQGVVYVVPLPPGR